MTCPPYCSGISIFLLYGGHVQRTLVNFRPKLIMTWNSIVFMFSYFWTITRKFELIGNRVVFNSVLRHPIRIFGRRHVTLHYLDVRFFVTRYLLHWKFVFNVDNIETERFLKPFAEFLSVSKCRLYDESGNIPKYF